MKRIYSASFTRQGAALQQKLGEFFSKAEIEYRPYAKYPVGDCLFLEDSLSVFAEKSFREADGILFIGAAGIAVRAVAPFVEKKDKDPAVLVVDDRGRYAVPILSGHLGGANALAEQLASFLGAEAVITTSTDGNALFSVDSFAVKQNAFIVEIDKIKAVSSEILKGNPVGFQSDYPVEGALPPELRRDAAMPVGILVSDDREKSPFKTTLHLVPRRVVLGVGCRKNIGYDLLCRQIMSALHEHNLTMEQVFLLASAELKRNEPALLRLEKEYKLVFRTYSADRLGRLPGSFTSSEFVKAQTGVDNVCERAALLAAREEIARRPGWLPCEEGNNEPEFLFRKTAGNGVTAAAVELKWRCRF